MDGKGCVGHWRCKERLGVGWWRLSTISMKIKRFVSFCGAKGRISSVGPCRAPDQVPLSLTCLMVSRGRILTLHAAAPYRFGCGRISMACTRPRCPHSCWMAEPIDGTETLCRYRSGHAESENAPVSVGIPLLDPSKRSSPHAHTLRVHVACHSFPNSKLLLSESVMAFELHH